MIRILLADDHPFVRHGVRQILNEEFPGARIGEACNVQELLDLLGTQSWDIVILDLSMPGRSGLDALTDLKHAYPGVPVLILSMHPEDQFAVRVLRAGASGYLTKESVPEELVQAVRKILGGGKFIRPSVADLLATHVVRGTADLPPHTSLSDREFQVLRLIAEGKTVTAIAEDLALSVKTVSTYRTRILEKLHFKNNSELIRYALQHHLAE